MRVTRPDVGSSSWPVSGWAGHASNTAEIIGNNKMNVKTKVSGNNANSHLINDFEQRGLADTVRAHKANSRVLHDMNIMYPIT